MDMMSRRVGKATPSSNPAIGFGRSLMPLAAAFLLLAVHRQQVADAASWSDFLRHLGALILAAAPLLLVHLLAARRASVPILALWGIMAVAYPLVGAAWAPGGLSTFEGLALVLASAVALFLDQRSPASMLNALRRLPITLDGVAASLAGLWAVLASCLFIATENPIENQPLKVWFDGQRIVDHPLLFGSYLLQFGLVAGLILGFYALCRHLLVRQVLRRHGVTAFLAASLIVWLIYTPLACSIVLWLPLRTADWTMIPSETANPFLPINYRFSAMLWIVICPILLASERLLARAEAADLAQAHARAELQALQQQVNPHFLFNTLNTLYALCLEDRETSAQAIVKLSDLLRYSIYDANEDWVPLSGEIAHLRNYLDLQQLRFAKRCRIEEDWPRDSDGWCMPPQLLIMLVENMFKHGVERSEGEVAMRIHLAIVDGRLHFEAINEPHSSAAGAGAEPSGVGLANLRRRLELLCGHDFVLESEAVSGAWRSRLNLALRSC